MPNAGFHRKLTIFGQIITLPVGIWAISGGFLPEFLAFQAGILVTYGVTPDADLHQKWGRIGNIIGLEDYEKVMPHRYGLSLSHWRENPWKAMIGSHAPITGSLLRGFVVLLPVIVLSIAITFQFGLLDALLILSLSLSFWLGMVYSDLWHLAADKLSTKTKRWWREQRRTV